MSVDPHAKPKRALAIVVRISAAVLVLAVVMVTGFGIGVFMQSKPDWAILSTTASDADFERRVAEFLAENPEAIADAFEEYAARQGGSSAISEAPVANRGHGSASRFSLGERQREFDNDPDSPVRGNANGDITLVEFFDYNCPYCQQILPILDDLQKSNPRLRVVYKEFPILTEHSRFVARAALASRKQDKYFEFHDALMSNGGIYTPDRVIQVARSVGLSIRRLRRDMDDPQIAATIERNLALATSLRITGTPSFVVDGRVFRGAADSQTLQALIDRAR